MTKEEAIEKAKIYGYESIAKTYIDKYGMEPEEALLHLDLI